MTTTGFAKNNDSGKYPANLVGHGGPVKAITINTSSGYALTGSFDYSAMLWKIRAGSSSKVIRRFPGHDGAVNAVEFVDNPERFISAGDDGFVYLWQSTSGKLLHRFSGHTAKIVDVAISAQKQLAATASWDRTARLWNLTTYKPEFVLKGHKGPVNAVLFSPDGKFLYSASYDGTIIKWDTSDGRLIRPVYRHGWGINVMAWLPGRKQILFGAINGDVRVFDTRSEKVTKVLIPHQRPVLALAVSVKGNLLATGGAGGLIRVWQLSDWSPVEELHSAFGPVWSMAFADTRHIYYSGLDDFVIAWKISPRDLSREAQGLFPRRFQRFANMSLGERQFARKCSVCHTLKPEDGNRAGPSLYGIFGRRAGSLKGYVYSEGLKNSNIIWNEDTIDKLFAHGPQEVTPGSKMPLQRIAGKKERRALIKFLKEQTAKNLGEANNDGR